MSDVLRYTLEVGVSPNVDVDDFEDFLQALLLDLYEQGSVESVTVAKDSHDLSTGEGMERVTDMLDGLDSEYIKRAIDMVEEIEKLE